MRRLGVPVITRHSGLFVAALLLFPLASSGEETACNCRKDPSPLEQQVRTAMRGADFVGLVQVQSTEFKDKSYEEAIAVWNPRTQQSDSQTRQVTQRLLVGKVKTLHRYKGFGSPTRIETPASANSCGVKLEPGATYLVYAYGDEDPELISTDQCMRTALQSASASDLKVLDDVARPTSVVVQPSAAMKRFGEAVELIYSHAGGGEERLQDPKFVENLSQAANIAEGLEKSDPLSGYSQALRAEMVSMWELGDDGQPAEAQQMALVLTDDALRINPKLAQAHVARARTYAKAGRWQDAEQEIQSALQIEPRSGSAMFVQADVYRLSGDDAKAVQWINNFTDASQQPVQKANGHEWLGRMYRDIAYNPRANNREAYFLMARSAFQWSIDLDPKDPWRLVNFAAFLNEYVADFAAAEKYAARALDIENLEPARYQLAAARYQSLQSRAEGMDGQALKAAIADVQATTGISLDQLTQPGGFREVVRLRLVKLQRRAGTPG